MKKQFLLAVIVLLALAAESSAQRRSKTSMAEVLGAREKILWEAWKNKQAAPFEAAMSADSVMVSEMGPAGKADMLQMIPNNDCDVQSYELSDFKVTMYNANTAMLTYKGTQTGTCGGKPLPATVMASTLWIRRGGKWWAAFHQETPVS